MVYLDRKIRLRVSECDTNNRWRIGAMLTEMQEIAGEQCEPFGCGRNAMLAEGLVWVVARMELHVIRYPVYGETVTLRTFNRPNRHWFFPRFFQFFDEKNELIGEASSLWLLMDLNTRQSVSAGRLPSPLPDNRDIPEPMPLPGSIAAVEGPERTLPWETVYTDLDANGHVNNTKYADWLCNALGLQTMTEHPPERIVIHYDSEIRPGNPLELRLAQDGLRFRMNGFYDGKNAFSIGGNLMA